MRRGEIWWAEFSEPRASEPGYRRPVVILQCDAFNLSRIKTVVVVALTSNFRLASSPGNVKVLAAKTGLSKDSVANASQIATLDMRFLEEKIGEIDRLTMRRIDEGVRLVLAL